MKSPAHCQYFLIKSWTLLNIVYVKLNGWEFHYHFKTLSSRLLWYIVLLPTHSVPASWGESDCCQPQADLDWLDSFRFGEKQSQAPGGDRRLACQKNVIGSPSLGERGSWDNLCSRLYGTVSLGPYFCLHSLFCKAMFYRCTCKSFRNEDTQTWSST